jgi:F0F1-type ATP synthase assembly protein I
MNNLSGTGKRLVIRVVLLQMGCGALAAVVCWIVQGLAAAVAALAGGLIVAVGSAVFGWRMFAPGIAPAAILLRALIAAESLKWFWYVLAIWAAFARLKLPPLPLLTGLVFAQFGYWLVLLVNEDK